MVYKKHTVGHHHKGDAPALASACHGELLIEC